MGLASARRLDRWRPDGPIEPPVQQRSESQDVQGVLLVDGPVDLRRVRRGVPEGAGVEVVVLEQLGPAEPQDVGVHPAFLKGSPQPARSRASGMVRTAVDRSSCPSALRLIPAKARTSFRRTRRSSNSWALLRYRTGCMARCTKLATLFPQPSDFCRAESASKSRWRLVPLGKGSSIPQSARSR